MKKNITTKIVLFAFAFLMVCTAVFAAPGNAEAAASPRKITLSAGKKVLYTGKSFQLKVKSVSPKKASSAVTYKAANKKIASVNSKGKVTAKKPDSTVITVTSKKNKKAKAACRIVSLRRRP